MTGVQMVEPLPRGANVCNGYYSTYHRHWRNQSRSVSFSRSQLMAPSGGANPAGQCVLEL